MFKKLATNVENLKHHKVVEKAVANERQVRNKGGKNSYIVVDAPFLLNHAKAHVESVKENAGHP